MTLGASGHWQGNRIGAGGTATLVYNIFGRSNNSGLEIQEWIEDIVLTMLHLVVRLFLWISGHEVISGLADFYSKSI